MSITNMEEFDEAAEERERLKDISELISLCDKGDATVGEYNARLVDLGKFLYGEEYSEEEFPLYTIRNQADIIYSALCRYKTVLEHDFEMKYLSNDSERDWS